jgi:periplasmic protein TonB
MTTNYYKTQLDDIIFESRNKAYGAYALRQAYGKQMKRGIIGGLSVFALLVSSPLIADRIAHQRMELVQDVNVISDVLPETPKPPVAPPPPPPPPPPPAKLIATIRFSPPVVTLEAETEPPMPKIEDISVNVGTKNQEGEKVETFVNTTIAAPVTPPIDEPKKPVEQVEKDFLVVEQMPEYKDGVGAMYRFFSENIKYPPIARENGIEGTVFVGFVVNKDGAIRDVVVKRGIGGGCNEEAVRVVAMMPKWREGRQNGKSVSVAFTVPIKFKLD